MPARRCRRARLLAIFAMVFGLVAAPAAPARAGHYEVSWTSPALNASLQGEQVLDFTIDSLLWLTHGKAREWKLEVLDGTGTSRGVLCSEDYGATGDDGIPVELVWDTRFYPGPAEPSGACDNTVAGSPLLPNTPDQFSANGAHTLRVWVKTNATLATGAHEETFDRSVKLDNSPQPPIGVSSSFDSANQQITVSWTPNSEPDVTGYAVDECVTPGAEMLCSSSDWSRVANPPVGTTGVSIAVDGPGAYSYRVAATRPHADGSEFLSSATQTGPVVLEAGEINQPATSVGGDAGVPGTGGSSAGQSASTGPATGAGGGGDAGEGSRGLAPRLIERTETDGGYEEALPYGAKPLDETGGDVLDIGPEGVGFALVPVAAGMALFVFAMQMRYLSGRAGALGAAGEEGPVTGVEADDPDAPVPLFRLGAGGSFISNWKRLLDQPAPRSGD